MREIGIDDYVAMVLRPGRDQMARRARAALKVLGGPAA